MTDPAKALEAVRAALRVTVFAEGAHAHNQALEDIEKLVGRLERLYIRNVAEAYVSGVAAERARCADIVRDATCFVERAPNTYRDTLDKILNPVLKSSDDRSKE